jgi:DNA-directed RNA polymerase subunit RPC12/RpoP
MIAYEPCSRCAGHGMVDYGYSVADCPECGGNCFVRARDSRGRFTKLPDPVTVEP